MLVVTSFGLILRLVAKNGVTGKISPLAAGCLTLVIAWEPFDVSCRLLIN